MKLSTLALSLFALLPLASCATICSPGPDMVSVVSDPPGATVVVDGMTVGSTPTMITLLRSADAVIELRKPGYKTARVDRDKVLNGWFFPGSLSWILLWPAVPISMVVDLASGNQGKYSTEPIFAKLQPGREDEVIDLTPKRRPTTGDDRVLNAGDLVVVPRNTAHGFTPSGTEPVVVLSIFAPRLLPDDRVPVEEAGSMATSKSLK